MSSRPSRLHAMFTGAIARGLIALSRMLTGTHVRYMGSTPESLHRQTIYFSNHTSHLDFMVLWGSLPRDLRPRTRPVAAADYWNRGPLRRLIGAEVFHSVLVNRGDSNDPATKAANVDALQEALAAGDSLILFPEGTRGDGRTVGPFRSGLYYMALQWPQVQLVPVKLENLHRVLPKGKLLPVPLMSRLTFGPPIQLGEGESKAAFLVRAREAVVQLRKR